VKDPPQNFADRVAYYVRHGVRSHSPAAFAFALVCVAAATLLRFAVEFISLNIVPFVTYFPAVLVATLIGGRAAGGFATLLSAVICWYAFISPELALFFPVRAADVVNVGLFFAACATIIWIADQYRRVLRRLDEEEHYRQVVVDELGHRVKNKLATINAILRHELRGRPEIWESVAGRLRALSASDDFLLNPGADATPLRDLLAMELQPYGENRVRMQGEPLRLRGRICGVLALVVHELATNAAKYGALSVEGGCVAIGWRMGGGNLSIDWTETGGPPVVVPERRSFGASLIERSLDGLGGKAELAFAPTGVVCRITLPREPHIVG
jgi:two-component sensor histidine kinase